MRTATLLALLLAGALLSCAGPGGRRVVGPGRDRQHTSGVGA